LLYISILLCVLRVLGGLSSFFFDATAKEEGRQEIPASRREEEEAPLFPGKQKPK
jgi:hypothetical protein